MERILKYRAYDHILKQIFPIEYFTDTEVCLTVFMTEYGPCEQFRSRDEVDIMEFTQRYDKNGSEIYSGHILQAIGGDLYDGLGENQLGVVKYAIDRAQFMGYQVPKFDRYAQIPVSDECEIVGDIYTTPDLIK